ncbi:MBL fold metallo-hydrolase [Agromyces protaetiae]|uniref:MBL fold metallo-hydrolase n=1 Tax=Agromyces protaetiae TaxID=2509455 RepID=A0A4P6FHW8_9MICO|nr:ComEC/Rec2 family competence protein [Agromyces protaetiae]QAY74149.1 MBL fold metallo-hydrolase [Agromyces protaetiae]
MSTARGRDLRLLLPAAVAWAAGWLAVGAPDAGIGAWVPAVALWAAAAVMCAVVVRAVLVARRRGPAARVAVVAAVAATLLVASAAGASVAHSTAVGLDRRGASTLASAAAEHRTVAVVVKLTSAPRKVAVSPSMPWLAGESRVRFEALVVSIDGRDGGSVPVQVTAEASEGLAFGAHAAFRASVGAGASADSAAFRLRPVDPLAVSPPPPWLAWAATLRAGFADAAERLGGDGGALVPGLAIGDTSAVGAELDASMKASSLSHLTAVSGANCAIVTALAFALAAACGLPRFARVAIALLALAAFVVLVTPEASVVRAAAMGVVVLVATASGRQGGGIAALSIAIIALLVGDPWLARDYGFALSVCATAGLLLLAGPLGAKLARFMPGSLALVLAVPIAAQLACQPVLIMLNPGVAVYGVVANLLAAPAAPVGTMVGLVGCLVLPVLPSVGFAALQIAWLPASWIALVAHGTAGLPGATAGWVPGAIGALLLAAVTGTGVWLLFARRRPFVGVLAASIMLIVAIAGPLGASVGAPALVRAAMPDDWDVAQCDIGQGDAVLVRDADAVALIDTGPDPAALARCLGLLGIDRIDLLVLTHWDADHVGGVAAVAGMVGTVLHGPLDGGRSSRPLDRLVESGAVVHEVATGAHGTLGDAAWRVLWPEPGAEPGNPASVVLEVHAGEWTGLFLGDLGEDAQRSMLARERPGRVDLVKVAHHGSADQYPDLYARLAADVGLVGVGADNGYGHPTSKALGMLAAAGTTAIRSDLDGTALLTRDEGVWRLWTERGDASGVAAGGEASLGSASAAARRLDAGGGRTETGWRQHAERRRRKARRPSRSSRGTRCVQRPSCSCRAPKTSSPTVP